MNEATFTLEGDILQLVNDARYAMQNPDEMTASDIQGRATAHEN